jgi:hypothetical protein
VLDSDPSGLYTVPEIVGMVPQCKSTKGKSGVKTLLSVMGLVASAVLFVACGGGDDGNSEEGTPVANIVPRAGLWIGETVQFYVSPDGSMITSSGSPLRSFNGAPCAIVFAAIPRQQAIPIVNGRFSHDEAAHDSIPPMWCEGQFRSSTEASGTLSVGGPTCGWTANANVPKEERTGNR